MLYKACSLLQEMQKCFDEKDIQMLQEVITKLDPTVGFFVKANSFVFQINSWQCFDQ